MLGLYVSLGDERTTRFEIPKTRVRIGTAIENDLVLHQGNVMPFHCELELVDGAWYVARCAAAPLRVRNVPVDDRTRVDDGSDITVGDYKLVLELVQRGADPATDAHERELLDDIAVRPGAAGAEIDAGRLVYADWLEERGDRFRAEFLRLSQQILGLHPRDRTPWQRTEHHRRRLRELANHIDIAWRERVARPPVLNCARRGCAMDWGQLVATETTSVRRCNGCGGDVAYCDDLEEARTAIARGERAVVDARVEQAYLLVPDESDNEEADTLDRS